MCMHKQMHHYFSFPHNGTDEGYLKLNTLICSLCGQPVDQPGVWSPSLDLPIHEPCKKYL